MTNLQRGIAIGPILFVVALLAVLAVAISAGTGVFNGDTSAIKAKAQASAILEYANEVKFAVDRLLAKGCKDTEISFENNVVSGYTNPNAPADKSCHVFDVNGGGIVWKEPPSGIDLSLAPEANRHYLFSGNSDHVGTYVSGNTTTDLTIKLLGMGSDVCEKIIAFGGATGDRGNVYYMKYTGTYQTMAGTKGQFGCTNLVVPNDGTPGYPLGLHYFFYVLYAR